MYSLKKKLNAFFPGEVGLRPNSEGVSESVMTGLRALEVFCKML